MKQLFKNFSGAILLSTLFTIASCGENAQQGKPDETQESETSGKVTILCDESVYDLMRRPVAMFDSVYINAEVTFEKTRARQAMGELLSGRAKGIIMAREYLRDEDSLMKAYNVTKHEQQLIARDALVFYTSRNFPLDTLNREQLRDVLLSSGEALKSAFPILNSEPVFVSPDENSSEYANLLKLVTNGQMPKHAFKTVGGADSVQQFVASNSNTIGIGYLSHVALDSNFKMLKIGFKNDSSGQYITPKIVHQSHIVMGNYPFEVKIYSYMLEKKIKQPAWGLFSFLARDPDVQLYFKNKGIVPGHARFQLVEE
jgi:ABC-type phosphate transport system substrate-binding protein